MYIGATNLSKGGLWRLDDVQVVWHDLRDVRHALDAEALEDERDGLHDHGVLRGERRVLDDAHERRDGDGRVELVERVLTHAHQHLARVEICHRRRKQQ